MPEEAKQQTKAGAEAFVRYYIEAVNHAQATGDVAPLEALALPSCDSCDALADGIREVYANGGRVEGGAWVVTFAMVLQIDGRTTVDVGLRFSPQRVWKSPSAAPQSYKGGKAPATYVLTPVDNGWAIRSATRGA